MIVLIISILLNISLIYATWNLLRKNELMEETIENFYTRLDKTLRTMRALDERQMFEKDDEVGDVFSQLTDTVDRKSTRLNSSH